MWIYQARLIGCDSVTVEGTSIQNAINKISEIIGDYHGRISMRIFYRK